METRGQSNLQFYIDTFRPSFKVMTQESWANSKGIHPYFYRVNSIPECYICGRQKDYIFNFVRLVPYLDLSLERLVYICDDHGRVTDYDCTTGESIELPLPKSYWYRHLRNFIQNSILWFVISFRFAWFFLHSVFMWYTAIYFYWYWKELKRKLCEP